MKELTRRRYGVWLVIGLILVLTLAACGGDDDDNDATDAPEPTNTIAAEAVVPGAGSGGDGADAANGANGDGEAVTDDLVEPADLGPIYVEIVGDPLVERTLTVDNWAAQVIDDFYILIFSNAEDNLLISIENIPPDIEPGIYEFASEEMGDEGDELFAFLQFDQDGETIYYSQDVEGSLEITEIEGSALSGSFTFTANRAAEDGEDAPPEPSTITVTGTFQNVVPA